MKWTQVILGSPSRSALLRSLAENAGHLLTVRELARLAGISPIQASRLVREFADLGIVSRQGGGDAPRVRADLSHPVMRQVVQPLLAFEDAELGRVASAIADVLNRRAIPCSAVLSSSTPAGQHRLIVVVPDSVDRDRVTALLRDPMFNSVVRPDVDVLGRSAVRGLSPQRLRQRWGVSLSRLLEEGDQMASLPALLYHAFEDGTDGWRLYDPIAQRVPWLGRHALMLGGGRPVLAPVAPEPPYAARAVLSGGPGECYVGICFHLSAPDNFETIYLAPAAGGKLEAIQYDPVINGSTTWQIFGDADGLAVAALAPERWHELRLDVWSDIARVVVDGEVRASFPLRAGLRRGRVGLWGYLPSYVAEFEVAPLDAPAPPEPAPKAPVPAGTVWEWLVARYDPVARAFADPRAALAEHNGTLCLNRLYPAEPGAKAYAACELEIPDDARDAAVELGYSDHVRVWLGGTLIHEDEWRWDPVAGTDGRVRPGHVQVPVRQRGRLLLLAEVTALEPGFGWGLTARAVADGRPCAVGVPGALHVPDDL